MRLRTLFVLLGVAACSQGSPAHPGPSVQVQAGNVGPDGCQGTDHLNAQAINDCLGRQAGAGACLDGLWQDYMVGGHHSTTEALALLQCYEDHDSNINVDCHPVAHAIGRITFGEQGTVDKSFAACDQTCHSGCYHGAMERFLRGDAPEGTHLTFAELQARAATACATDQPSRFRFQCLHGLGHAVTYYSGYALDLSLSVCDATGDEWSQSSCWGGVFMENIAAADPTQRDLSATDYHYPCDKVGEKYRSECYVMQTSRMAEMGLNPSQILDECKKIAYAESCISSLGRDMSDTARGGNPREASAICEKVDGDLRKACTRGVVFALSDNTWDPRWVFPFCRTYEGPSDAIFCYATAINYLRDIYVNTTDSLRAACGKFVPGDSRCIVALGQ